MPLADFDELLVSESQAGPEAALLQKERSLAVQRAISSLPEASRAVLVLREYGGLPYQEISSALDIPLGTVMSRLNYGRDRLKAILSPEMSDLEIDYV
jgi:RNA polymerase sigma-70 factor (ECF subfamily)